MKKRTLLIVSIILYALCILLAPKAKAQNIGINPTGATPNASAGLDIDFTNKGLLIPRVALTATNSASPLTSPATSVLIYNTATAGAGATAVIPGYYYWSGSAWISLQTNGGSGSIWSRTSGNVFLTTTSDNIGIGTSSPLAKLHLSGGNAMFDPSVFVVNQNGDNIIGNNGSIPEMSDASLNGFQINIPAQSSSSGFYFRANGPSNDAFWNASGMLGLGTINPTERLHIGNGNVRIDPSVFIINQNGDNIIGNNGSIPEMSDASLNGFQINIPAQSSSSGFYFRANGPSNDAFWNASGMLGLGTVNPTERLHIGNGNVRIDPAVFIINQNGDNIIGNNGSVPEMSDASLNGFQINIPAQSSSSGIYFKGNGPSNDGFWNSMGMLGLGTINPTERLDVSGKTKTQTLQVTTGATSGYVLTSDASGNATWQAAASATATTWGLLGNTGTTAGTNFVGTTDAKDLVFKTTNTERIRILSSGNVGIGTAVPAAKLDVNGKTKTSTFQLTTGAALGYVLSSDNLGNATWTPASALGAWGLYGNSGTSVTTNFIGTTDSVPMIFKMNNHISGRIGTLALWDQNTSFGNFAFASFNGSITGAYNTAIGTKALYSSTDGYANVAVGDEAMYLNTDGDFNTANGTGALRSNLIGSYNTASGYYSLYYSTGDGNTASGYEALYKNTSGKANTGIGTVALKQNTTGEWNVALGNYTLQANTTGVCNVACGGGALAYNTTASRNTAIGNGALVYHAFSNGNAYYASNNVAVGDSSLYNNNPTAATNGINNTAIGTESGRANTTGYNNTFLGYKTSGVATINNSTAIGANAFVSISNAIVLGTSTENVGIGTSNPSSKLEVAGQIKITGGTPGAGKALVSDAVGLATWQTLAGIGAAWSLTGNSATIPGTNYMGTSDAIDFVVKTNALERMRILAGGEIGIGTTTPNRELTVGTNVSTISVYAAAFNNIIEGWRGLSYASRFNMGAFGETNYEISNNTFTTTATEYVFGTSQQTNNFRSGTDNTKSLGTAAARWTTVYATNGTINTSDRREKENIQTIHYGLNEIMKLKPVSFNWIGDEKKKVKLGLIAQEILPVIKEVVYNPKDDQPQFIRDENGKSVPNPNYIDRYGVYYSDLIPVLIKAIQEQQAMITDLQNKVDKMGTK